MKFEFNEKLTKEELVSSIIELYCYYFRKCRSFDIKGDSPEINTKYAAACGASEAIGAVALLVLGGEQLYKIWEQLTREA